jgi:hypothetical protein
MSFGLFQGQNFAERFPVNVFEALPAPSPVTSEVQFARAREIEAAYIPDSEDWKEGSKRYLFFMVNNFEDVNGLVIGGFYDCPLHVKRYQHEDEHYPAEFRWFVIDPAAQDEVEFIGRVVSGFWDTVEAYSIRKKKYWWEDMLVAHHEALMLLEEARDAAIK